MWNNHRTKTSGVERYAGMRTRGKSDYNKMKENEAKRAISDSSRDHKQASAGGERLERAVTVKARRTATSERIYAQLAIPLRL